MRKLLISLLLIGIIFADSFLIVIDVSGSMIERLPNSTTTKIDAAKNVAKEFINASSITDETGIMRFSGCPKDMDPFKGGIIVAQQFTNDKVALSNAIDSLTTGGSTPIAAALNESFIYYKSIGKKSGIIILITDGEETCNGKPEEIAALICKENIAVVNVIGYSLNAKQIEAAKAIANAGCGKFYTANNELELKQALFAVGQKDNTVLCLGIGAAIILLLTLYLYFRKKGDKVKPETHVEQ